MRDPSVLQRNHYIDLIKIVFALLIVFFHIHGDLNLFPGGRIAVEGFFMISGFLMMRSIAKDKRVTEPLGRSTVRFLAHKWLNLLPFLLPAAILAFVSVSVFYRFGLKRTLLNLPLFLFEIVPLYSEGFRGVYYIGISWYLSSMFFALAVLYPLCKKFGSDFTLIAFLPVGVGIYGLISYKFGHLAVGQADWLEEWPTNMGILRGLAGCLLGCVIYEVSDSLRKRAFSPGGKRAIAVIEIVCYALYFCLIQWQPKSSYDFVLVFVTFVFLIIGLSGHSLLEPALRQRNTKWLSTVSTLLILNHYPYIFIVERALGEPMNKIVFLVLVLLCILLSCLISWVCGRWVRRWIHAIPQKLFSDSDDG